MTTPTADHLDLLRDVVDARFSCRAFLPDPVPTATIREVLEIAQRSASWANTQPWHVVLVGGEEIDRFRDHLMSAASSSRGVSDVPPPAQYIDEFRDRRRASGFALYDSLGIAYDDHEGRKRQMLENFRFFGAPHVAIVTSEATLGPYGYVDTGAFISGFLLAAAGAGVATIAQAAIGMHADAVREYLSIPEHRHIVCGISFGYADRTHRANGFRTQRAEFDDVFDLSRL